jgi:hypothetical protein
MTPDKLRSGWLTTAFPRRILFLPEGTPPPMHTKRQNSVLESWIPCEMLY